jgi:hypothetical protein
MNNGALSIVFYGVSRPTNLPFPNKKSIALLTFLSMLSSDFRNEIYLIISCLFDGDNLSKTSFASILFFNASNNFGYSIGTSAPPLEWFL